MDSTIAWPIHNAQKLAERKRQTNRPEQVQPREQAIIGNVIEWRHTRSRFLNEMRIANLAMSKISGQDATVGLGVTTIMAQ
jgi:hypothetical protein